MEPFRGSKYVALIEPFKVLNRTFSSKSVYYEKMKVFFDLACNHFVGDFQNNIRSL